MQALGSVGQAGPAVADGNPRGLFLFRAMTNDGISSNYVDPGPTTRSSSAVFLATVIRSGVASGLGRGGGVVAWLRGTGD